MVPFECECVFVCVCVCVSANAHTVCLLGCYVATLERLASRTRSRGPHDAETDKHVPQFNSPTAAARRRWGLVQSLRGLLRAAPPQKPQKRANPCSPTQSIRALPLPRPPRLADRPSPRPPAALGHPARPPSPAKTGAGVAALLVMHYRARYPSICVRAWCYAPPGGLMSPGASAALEDCCHTLVSSKDMIPRMSLWTTELLRAELMQAALRCKVSKTRLLLGTLLGRTWREDEVLVPFDQLPLEKKARCGTAHVIWGRRSVQITNCVCNHSVCIAHAWPPFRPLIPQDHLL
ncbi:MAG: hypothetical protein J3K34DRAFT_432920 [Monoraphidium minutum]|nr:MAG: hypothetical protein J3K34DRAFT_432920 [Monoraphidium minutum]